MNIDMDLDTIIYIIVTIVVIASSFLGKKKKKPQSATEAAQARETGSNEQGYDESDEPVKDRDWLEEALSDREDLTEYTPVETALKEKERVALEAAMATREKERGVSEEDMATAREEYFSYDQDIEDEEAEFAAPGLDRTMEEQEIGDDGSMEVISEKEKEKLRKEAAFQFEPVKAIIFSEILKRKEDF